MNRITQLVLVTVASTALALPAFAGKTNIKASPASSDTVALLTQQEAVEAKKTEYMAAKQELKEARKAKRAEVKALWTGEEFDADAIRAVAAEREAERQAKRADRLEERLAAFAAMTQDERVKAFDESPVGFRGDRRGKRNHGEKGMRGEGDDGECAKGDRKRGGKRHGRRGGKGHGEGHGPRGGDDQDTAE